MPKPSYVNKNKSILELKLETLIENGRQEITTKKELEEFQIGSLISYINTNGIFKVGGFVTKITDEYFIYLDDEFENKFRVRFNNVKKMYVGNVYDTKNDIVSIVKSDKTETKYPVTIDDIIVYYGYDSHDMKRYLHTKKYKLMDKWITYFKK